MESLVFWLQGSPLVHLRKKHLLYSYIMQNNMNIKIVPFSNNSQDIFSYTVLHGLVEARFI